MQIEQKSMSWQFLFSGTTSGSKNPRWEWIHSFVEAMHYALLVVINCIYLSISSSAFSTDYHSPFLLDLTDSLMKDQVDRQVVSLTSAYAGEEQNDKSILDNVQNGYCRLVQRIFTILIEGHVLHTGVQEAKLKWWGGGQGNYKEQ